MSKPVNNNKKNGTSQLCQLLIFSSFVTLVYLFSILALEYKIALFVCHIKKIATNDQRIVLPNLGVSQTVFNNNNQISKQTEWSHIKDTSQHVLVYGNFCWEHELDLNPR